jgi:hypothetical protein
MAYALLAPSKWHEKSLGDPAMPPVLAFVPAVWQNPLLGVTQQLILRAGAKFLQQRFTFKVK